VNLLFPACYFLNGMVVVLNLDGQQRLATATILLSAIRDYFNFYDHNAAVRLGS
jgi:uncharacterized protein with ParB-like and HNH nuclease domain